MSRIKFEETIQVLYVLSGYDFQFSPFTDQFLLCLLNHLGGLTTKLSHHHLTGLIRQLHHAEI